MDQNGQITKVLYTPQSVLIETATTTSQVVPQPPAAPAPSQARIEIVSEGNYLYHLDSPHCIAPASVPTWDATTADCQLVELGAFVYDAQGNVLKGVDLIASTTDPAQNRVIHGTGIGDGHYQYNFLVRAQTNIVQFIANGVSASITMIAQ